MVKVADASSFNAEYFRDRQINAVVVGGTAGIGKGIALKLAAYCQNPVITICGRNENTALDTIEELKKINDKGTYDFERCDMTLLKESRDLAKRITAKYDKINLLIITSGFISFDPYSETEDGIDSRFTISCAARFLLTYYLVPLLQAAARKGETAAALSVLSAGQGKKFIIDDIALKENFTLSTALGRHHGVLNDIMAEAFSKHYPEVSFHHSYPGVVNTELTRNLPWYVRYPSTVLGFFGMSIEDCGDYSLYGIASHLKEKTGFWSLIKQDGETVQPTKFQTKEACDKSWNWFMDLLNEKGFTELN
ncbi:hypothetical protein NQZ79_g1149 [Umbelopsis isabellina]|nr:hypothetical protein NQZ79_g1149 [Umbelopsis isabellina]